MVLELPVLARENQDWKIYRTHILDSAAMEGVVSHLTGAAPKPFDSRKLEAWNWSNLVAKYIMLEVISDSLLERLMHHELAHTLFSHLTAIFGDHDPIAIEPPAKQSHPVEPLREDLHPKKAALGGEPVERAYRVELESCEGVESMDGLNESENPDGGGIPHVCLGGMRVQVDNVNGPGNWADVSKGQVDGLMPQTDGLGMSNSSETVGMRHSVGAGTYLGPGDTEHDVDKTDGIGSHADASVGHGESPSVETNANRPANAPEIVRTTQKRGKLPDLPSQSVRRATDKPNGVGDVTNTLSVQTDDHSIGNDTGTAENEMKSIRTCRNGSKMQNSPIRAQIAMPEPTYHWSRVSVDNIDVYVPPNALIETASRNLVFGQVEGGEELIAVRNVKERAGSGDGDRNGGNTTSSSKVDLSQVEAVLQAGETQWMHYRQRKRNGNLPMLSGSPTPSAERLYGHVRCRR
ncbi:hypothetical protein SCLCIDRAFT_30320 [Scleroderma citrinum Foug A]|uniref:Uncharacterized protein n=1 Tax=Scleroderma citrinum Foug A TaxID=1036808 RepID=A0A0C3DGR0_9AGAM|nr:hypothetical protein SCLCIDRAFT_30320 [Scleroderma citrinum Foug A]